MKRALILAIGLAVAACSDRGGRTSITETEMLGRYKANFADRTDEIELLPGGRYRHTTEYRSTHDQHTGEWSVGPEQTEITLRDFKFNWPSPLRSLPDGGIGGMRHFPPVADWTTAVRVEHGIPMLLIAQDDR